MEVIEFFRGRPRGGDNFFTFSKRSRPLIQSVKSLGVATPSGAPHQAPLEEVQFVAGYPSLKLSRVPFLP